MYKVLEKIKENVNESVSGLENQGVSVKEFTQEFGSKKASKKFKNRNYIKTTFSVFTNDVEEISINEIINKAFDGITGEQLGLNTDDIQYSLKLDVDTPYGFNVRKTYVKVNKSKLTLPDVKVAVVDESVYLIKVIILEERRV